MPGVIVRAKSVILVLVAVTICSLLLGCPKRERSTASKTSTIIVGFASGPDSLDPLRFQSARAGLILERYCFMTPLTRDVDGTLRAALATGPPIVDGPRHEWTLRREAVWSDGTPITTADVVATWKRLADPEARVGRLRRSIQGIDNIEDVDEQRFVVTWNRVGHDQIETFGTRFVPLPSTVTEGEVGAVGSGPYRIESHDDDTTVLVRRRPWWGNDIDDLRDRFHVERLCLSYVESPDVLARRLRDGDVDLCGLNDETAAELRRSADANVRARSYFLPGFGLLGWNTTRAPFDRPDVRRALARMIPRDVLIRRVFEDDARSLSGVFATDDSPRAIDVATATRELDAAKIADVDGDGRREANGAPLTVTLLVPAGETRWVREITTAWREPLAQIGVTLELRPLVIGALVAKLRLRDYDAFMVMWRVDLASPTFRDLLHSSQVDGGRNFTGYRSTAMDAAIESLESAGDATARRAAEAAFDAHLRIHHPITPLFRHASHLAWRPQAVEVTVGKFGLDWTRLRPAR